MIGDIEVQTNCQLEIVLREDWPFTLRQAHSKIWTAAITVRGTRQPSRLVDADGQRLIEIFAKPRELTDAILLFSAERGADPFEVLEAAAPFLESLVRSHVLVPLANEAESGLAPVKVLEAGSKILGCQVMEAIHVLSDTQVYRVSRDGVQYALKTVHPDATWPLVALRNEAAVLQILNHRAVPKLLEAQVDGSMPYLLLEWRSGSHSTLAAAELRRLEAPYSRLHLLSIVNLIVRTYAELHALDILHGDVQPRNVLLNSSGDLAVSLVDFGFAVSTNGKSVGSAVVPCGGVASYQAPELMRSKSSYLCPSLYSEQYAIACLCYELVTGAFPFDRTASEPEFRTMVLSSPVRKFSDVGSEGWSDLEKILLKAMNTDPLRRYGSTLEFAEALTALSQDAANTEPFRTRRPTEMGSFQALNDVGELYPPLASVNYGAAGIAFAMYRRAQIESDGTLLADAMFWSRTAMNLSSQENAFANSMLGISSDTVGSSSLYHSQLGVLVVSAVICISCDEPWEDSLRAALAILKEPLERFDLTTGKAGHLLACAHLYSKLRFDEHPLSRDLIEVGDQILHQLWSREWSTRDHVPGCSASYLGIAHGWSGLLYATLVWCRLLKRTLPRNSVRVLSQLVGLAQSDENGCIFWPVLGHVQKRRSSWPGWCHGSAGHAMLYCEASAMDKEYLALARGAALHCFSRGSRNITLCCGSAGEGYALLALFRKTKQDIWLRRAQDLLARTKKRPSKKALFTNSLYKGELGIRALEADLKMPEFSGMPLFEIES